MTPVRNRPDENRDEGAVCRRATGIGRFLTGAVRHWGASWRARFCVQAAPVARFPGASRLVTATRSDKQPGGTPANPDQKVLADSDGGIEWTRLTARAGRVSRSGCRTDAID